MQLVRTAQSKHKINLLALSTEDGGLRRGHLVCSINSMQFVHTAQFKHKHLLALSTEDGGPPAPRVRSLYLIFFLRVTPACVWCCDASTSTEHENHQTSNLNMKYSGEHNKGSVQITGRYSQPTGNDHKQELCPPMSIVSSPDQSRRRTFLPLTNYGFVRVVLNRRHNIYLYIFI